MWDSRGRAQHYTKKDWPFREELVPCKERNVINDHLVDIRQNTLPMATDQAQHLIRDPDFENFMNKVELEAWKAFVLVMNNFPGSNKARNYAEIINNMLTAFRNLGCNMGVKMHYLFSHMNRFPENLGSMSDEQGERFHQDLKEMEIRYQGHWDAVMMADYCWNLKRDLPVAEHSRSSKKWKFKPWSLNNGEAICNLHLLTFINAHHSVYSYRCFYQVINICCWQNIFFSYKHI